MPESSSIRTGVLLVFGNGALGSKIEHLDLEKLLIVVLLAGSGKMFYRILAYN